MAEVYYFVNVGVFTNWYSIDTHNKANQDLDTIAPTADKTTYRLASDGLRYATTGDLWQFGIVSIAKGKKKVALDQYVITE